MKTLNCDLLVAGAGIAGMCAAVAAARKGLDVILINDRSVLGGNASSEIGVAISGANHHGLNPAIYAKECGLVEELRLMLLKYNENGGYGRHALYDAVFFDFIYNESNIRLFMNTLVEGCVVENGKIKYCIARHSISNEEFQISALNYIDATGNGTLAFEAGAEYRIGREAKSEYNEFWAPDEKDDYTMGNTIYFDTEDADHEVKFTPPKFAHNVSEMEFMKDINKPENFRGVSIKGSHWTYEYGGQTDILADHDATELELRKLIYGIWDYIKNSGKYPEAKNKYLKRVYAKAGTRESRRFIGDYVLNENDIENKVNFEDSVAIGGWPMDIHAPLGIYDKAPASNFVPVTGIYNIPFRSLYSKDIENLMLAGRDISATHIALGSTRVMATCGALGQAVGTAAYISKKYSKTPREIANKYIKELQDILLSDDQSILHRKDTVSMGFSAYATSEKVYENTELSGYMPLERDYCLALMSDTENIDSIELMIKAKKDTELKYKILGGSHKETYLPDTIIKECSMKILKDCDDWVKININSPVSEDGKIYIVLIKNDDIEIGIGNDRVMGAVTLRMHTESNHEKKNHDSVPMDIKTGYTSFDHHYERNRNILFKNILPKQHVFGADKALNGYSRPYGMQNIWIGENAEGDEITFKANEKVSAREFTIVLDSDLHTDQHTELLPTVLAKDITVFVTDGDDKEHIFKISDNYMRTIKIELSGKEIEIKEIKIRIDKTYGSVAGIFGIRI